MGNYFADILYRRKNLIIILLMRFDNMLRSKRLSEFFKQSTSAYFLKLLLLINIMAELRQKNEDDR